MACAHYRCSYCGGRYRFTMEPHSYKRPRRCKNVNCIRSQRERGVMPRWYADRWREKHEVGPGSRARVCYPGRDTCNGYPFPHRKGSKWCHHNPELTAEDLQEQWEGQCK